MSNLVSRAGLIALGFVGGVTVALVLLAVIKVRTSQPPPLSDAYKDPEGAMLLALEEVDATTQRANPYAPEFIEKADLFRRLYHIASADEGELNEDTSDYQSWLTNHVRVVTNALGTEPTTESDYRQVRRHIQAQVEMAIFKPQSEIGKRIRQMEAGEDPLVAESGTTVYWDYLVEPSVLGTLALHPAQTMHVENRFRTWAEEYRVARLRNPEADMTFGDYLMENDYRPSQMLESNSD